MLPLSHIKETIRKISQPCRGLYAIHHLPPFMVFRTGCFFLGPSSSRLAFPGRLFFFWGHDLFPQFLIFKIWCNNTQSLIVPWRSTHCGRIHCDKMNTKRPSGIALIISWIAILVFRVVQATSMVQGSWRWNWHELVEVVRITSMLFSLCHLAVHGSSSWAVRLWDAANLESSRDWSWKRRRIQSAIATQRILRSYHPQANSACHLCARWSFDPHGRLRVFQGITAPVEDG